MEHYRKLPEIPKLPESRPEDFDDPAVWGHYALCREVADPDMFFPESETRHSDPAKRVCAKCEVRAECLDFALKNNEKFGIWGGLNTKERNELKQKSRRQFR